VEAENFSLRHRVKTDSKAHRVPGALFLGVKRQRCEADHSPLSSGEVKECVDLYFHSLIRRHGVVLS